jgi:hypothetical protein
MDTPKSQAKMKTKNIHEREFEVSYEQVGTLVDSLASDDDRLWPIHTWPHMQFDRPLSIGAKGGHGPIGYFVEEYNPGKSIYWILIFMKLFFILVVFKYFFLVVSPVDHMII